MRLVRFCTDNFVFTGLGILFGLFFLPLQIFAAVLADLRCFIAGPTSVAIFAAAFWFCFWFHHIESC